MIPTSRHRGRVVIREFIRRGIEPILVDGRKLCGGARPSQKSLVRAPHAITHGKSGSARAELGDRARQVAADHVRKRERHRHQPRPEIKVDRVERGGVHLDQHLPGACLRFSAIHQP